MTRLKMIDLPPDLDRTRLRFEQWRRTRKTRSRIPLPLWTAAAKMAGRYGINRTARALRLDYNSLKERVEKEPCSGVVGKGDGASRFLELAVPAAAGSSECIVELEDAAGAKMRVQFKSVDVPDLAALTRSFLGRAEA